MGEAVDRAPLPCSRITLLAKGEKCQVAGDSAPGHWPFARKYAQIG